MEKKGKLIIFSAPSGSGKTTIVRRLLSQIPELSFSISATNRQPRPNEVHGRDYYFLSDYEFKIRAENNEFLEWEEVYAGIKYGTLRREVARIWSAGKHVIFDIDVVGGLNLKRQFPVQSLAVFVRVPDLRELEKRLRKRATDSNEKIAMRLAKAEKEMERAPEFDLIIDNIDLRKAEREAFDAVNDFIN